MAAKKKSVKKKSKAKKPAARKAAIKKAAIKRAAKGNPAKNKKKTAPKRPTAKARPAEKRGSGAGVRKQPQRASRSTPRGFSRDEPETLTDVRSGDMQAISTVEDADSESVEELLDEGNAFEAGVVGGVEEADEGVKEVTTHEVPEDDVPEEYLDNE